MPCSVKRKASRKRNPKYNTKKIKKIKKKITKKIGSQKGGLKVKVRSNYVPTKNVPTTKLQKVIQGLIPVNKKKIQEKKQEEKQEPISKELRQIFNSLGENKPLINYYKMLNSNDQKIKKIVELLKDKSQNIQKLNKLFFNSNIKQSEKLKYLNIRNNLNISKGKILNFANKNIFEKVTQIKSNNKNLVKKLIEQDYIKLKLNQNKQIFLELNNQKLKNNKILDNLGLSLYKIDNLSDKSYKGPQFKRQMFEILYKIKSKNDLNVIKEYLETKKNKIDITNFNEYIKTKKKKINHHHYEYNTSTRENS